MSCRCSDRREPAAAGRGRAPPVGRRRRAAASAAPMCRWSISAELFGVADATRDAVEGVVDAGRSRAAAGRRWWSTRSSASGRSSSRASNRTISALTGIAAATILGDGRVALILDVAGRADRHRRAGQRRKRPRRLESSAGFNRCNHYPEERVSSEATRVRRRTCRPPATTPAAAQVVWFTVGKRLRRRSGWCARSAPGRGDAGADASFVLASSTCAAPSCPILDLRARFGRGRPSPAQPMSSSSSPSSTRIVGILVDAVSDIVTAARRATIKPVPVIGRLGRRRTASTVSSQSTSR